MSGTPLMLKPLPLSVTEMVYLNIIKELGLENSSTEERVQRLVTISPGELVASTPMSIPLVPYLDGDLVPEAMTFATLAGTSLKTPKWCEEVMIGDSQHDGNVFLFMGLAERKAGIASALTSLLSKNLSIAAAGAVINAYGIDTVDSDDDAMSAIISLATDIAYYTPAVCFARSFPGKTFYYNFNEPNPWEGAFKGCATHLLDAVFLFQNFNEHLSRESQEVGKRLGRDFISFANGVPPWGKFSREIGQTMVYGPSSESAADCVEKNGWEKGRRDTLFKLSEKGIVDLDQLSAAWDLFIAGK